MSGPDRIPMDVRTAVESVSRSEGAGSTIVDAGALGGGCIHPAAAIRTDAGAAFFVKWSQMPGPVRFGVEARGLRALSDADGPRIPQVLGWSDGTEETRGWLLLELIEPGRATAETADRLGSDLARLHRGIPGAAPGWHEDGVIGSLHQRNGGEGLDWPTFWVEARLRPQWESVHTRMGRSTAVAWTRLLPRIDEALEGWEADGLSLLHGDLWSGNVLTDQYGGPVLIDPAVYRGHREVDLAMMELFEGFRETTFERYRASAPLAPGYEERRRDAYQLYPLLVHVNLFGASYVGGVAERIHRLLATVG